MGSIPTYSRQSICIKGFRLCCWNHNLSGLDKICFQIFLDKIYFRVWGACVPSLYDILDSIPARTFAAPLEPIGLGTPYVESLTSYVTRLAAFHRLQVSVLMHPQLVGYVIPASSQKLNGMEGHAESALRIIEGMTGRPDLAGLTCLPMKDEVSPQRLLADMQRWCPQCYQLQRDSQKPIYDPLMWSLQVATTCLDHGIPLVDQCPQCHRRFTPLRAKARPGLCSWCQGWLGADRIRFLQHDGGPEQRLASLLSKLSEPSGARKLRLTENIRALVGLYGAPSLAASAGVARATLDSHSNGDARRFQLEVSLKLADGLGISVHALVLEEIDLSDFAFLESPKSNTRQSRRLRQATRVDRSGGEVKIKERMTPKVVHCIAEHDFSRRLTLKDLAANVGCSMDYLMTHFPGLANELRERFAIRLSGRMRAVWESTNLPIPLSEVAKRCDVNIHSANRLAPELCQEIKQAHQRYRDGLREAKIASIRAQFSQLLKDTWVTPLSQQAAAARLGVTQSFLYLNVRDLYQECGQRHQLYRHSCGLIREVVRAESIRKAIAELMENGQRPTPSALSARYGFYYRDPLVLKLVSENEDKDHTRETTPSLHDSHHK